MSDHLISRSKQRGASLAVSLILLVILGLLGAWAASSNVLQERMSGATRNRDLALQAAEAALREGENFLQGQSATWHSTGPTQFTGLNGLLTYSPASANDLTYWREPDNWPSYRTATTTLNQVQAAPQYIIQRQGNLDSANASIIYYRVTAKAVGGDANAEVILQSVVAYTP